MRAINLPCLEKKNEHRERANGSPNCIRNDQMRYQNIRRGVTKILMKLNLNGIKHLNLEKILPMMN